MLKTSAERYLSQSSYGIHYEKLRYHSLHHAVYDMRIPQIQLLLKLQPDLINFRTDLGLTPLMIACCLAENRQKDKIISMLVRAPKLCPYETDHCKRSAAFYLANFSTLFQLQNFIEKTKFNFIDERDIDGNTLLHYATLREDLGILEFLINLFKSHDIDINITNSLHYSPLLLACKLKKFKSAAMIIKMGASGFMVRDNEHFRTCLEWIELEEDDEDTVESTKKFYFYHFDIDSHNKFKNLMRISTQSIPPRHIDCFSELEKCQTFINIYNGQENFSSRKSFERSKSFNSLEDIRSFVGKQSTKIKELQSMSDDDAKKFLLSSLKSENRIFNRPKRTSISLRDKICLPRHSAVSSVFKHPFSYSRESSSAEIAHKILNKLPAEYY